MKALCFNSSINGANSTSSSLTRHFLNQLFLKDVISEQHTRDLTEQPLPELSAASIACWSDPSQSDSQLTQASDQLITQVDDHDILIIAAPLYNYTIPTSLKNALDNLARHNITFRYDEQGHHGLLGKDKTVVIIHTCGGFYQGKAADSVSSYLDHFLQFIGFNSIEHIWAEGLDIDTETRAQALGNAQDALDDLAARLTPLRQSA